MLSFQKYDLRKILFNSSPKKTKSKNKCWTKDTKFETKERGIPQYALHIPNAHDFCVISAHVYISVWVYKT